MKHLHFDWNLLSMCEDGYHYCRTCERATEVNVDGPVNCCVQCGSSAIEFRLPIFSVRQEWQHDNQERVA